MRAVPNQVRVVEVGPRDGLQNEEVLLSTDDKIRFIEMLAEAGLRDIEVTSFVRPDRIPQLSDAEAVLTGLSERPGVRFSALVPNRRGLERAIEVGCRDIAFFTAATQTFARRNIGMGVEESLAGFRDMMPDAKVAGMRVRAYVSTAFVCPFEGPTRPEQVVPVVRALVEMGVDEVSVADTIGHAVPTQVAALTEALLPVLPPESFAYHFHDTRGTALANVLTALQYGIQIFDAAAGGAGGCPFAPGAAGNLATEDLLHMLHGMGIETGVDIEKTASAALFLEALLGSYLPGRYIQSDMTGGVTEEEEPQ
jgi:isopropylmalate/homocitrate/citramalate synthase